MKRILFFFYVLTMITACHKVSDKTPAEDHIAKATTFIDQGDYGSAIELLEDTMKHEDTYEVRLVLASAYAGKAGIKVENYWDYLVGFDAFAKDKAPEAIPDVITADMIPEKLDEKSKSQLKNLNDSYKGIQRLDKKIEKVPLIQTSDRPYLKKARALLEQTPTASSKLYRSLLTVVMIKSEIQDGKELVAAWSDASFDPCFAVLPEVSVWLSKVLDLVGEGLDDLGHAYPNDKDQYQAMRKQVDLGNDYSRQALSYQKSLDNVCAAKQ
ncbi:MAG: hypothetical protein B7Y39_09425 [Bdellovibrio sp. 28-41-41]|nr:MAG: hypothetical protein B7Y39_09425 [Bdellovibrio sp. 28-41-41]